MTESVIDFPKDTLCPEVWDKVMSSDGSYETFILKQEVEDILFEVIDLIMSETKQHFNIFHITGSITSNSYTKNADIDLHFLSDQYEVDDVRAEEINKMLRTAYQKRSIGSHPIEVYYQKNKFQDMMSVGCYDLSKRDWIVGPELKDAAYNPYSDLYKDILKSAHHINKKVQTTILSIYEQAIVCMKLLKGNDKTVFNENLTVLKSKLLKAGKLYLKIRNKRKVYSDPTSKELALEYRNSRKWHIADATFKLLDKFGYLAILKDFSQLQDIISTTEVIGIEEELMHHIIDIVKNNIGNEEKLADSEVTEDEEGIANNDIYLSNMSKSFGDKAWFLRYLPNDITTIVDFGGGAGEFAEYCRAKLKRKMTFVIIDNNTTFLNAAKKKGFLGFESLDDMMNAKDVYVPSKTCLVLSSVIHEIYSYKDAFFDDVGTFWTNIKRCNFKTIAIRDMSIGGSAYDNVPTDAIIWIYKNVFKSDKLSIKGVPLKDITESFEDNWGAICDIESNKVDVHRLVHFLIKYRYQENWKREVKENYLPVSQDKLKYWIEDYCGYSLSHKESSKIEFYKKTWAKDFKLNIPDNGNYRKKFYTWLSNLNTHIKWLGEKSVSESENLNEGLVSNLTIAALLAIPGILPKEALAKELGQVPKVQMYMTSKSVLKAIDNATKDNTMIGDFSYRNSINILQWVYYTEAANQILEGRKAIFSILWNRAGGKPENLVKVALKNGLNKKGVRVWQFSEWNPGNNWGLVAPKTDSDWQYKVPKDLSNPKVKKIWKEAEEYAKEMLNGRWKSNIGKCNMIASDKDNEEAKSTWGKDCHWQIGSHRFGYDPYQDGFRTKKFNIAKASTPTNNYIVKKGDSLWKIAKAYDMTAKELAAKNNIDVNSILKLGQKLKV